MADYDAVIVGSGINSLAARRDPREGRLAGLRARAQRLPRRRREDGRADRARLPPRRLQRLAPALGRRRRARRARRRSRRPRARVPQHRLPDRLALPRRLRRVPAALDRRERRRARELRRGRRRGLEGDGGRLLRERGPLVRPARHRALVFRGRPARAQGVPPARPARAARVHRRPARLVPRLGLGDVRLGARARPARAVGAAHGARARTPPRPGSWRR